MFSLSLASWDDMAVRVGNTTSLPGFAWREQSDSLHAGHTHALTRDKTRKCFWGTNTQAAAAAI